MSSERVASLEAAGDAASLHQAAKLLLSFSNLREVDAVPDPEEVARAVGLLRESAGQGFAPSQIELAVLLLRATGEDADAGHGEAVSLLKNAAAQENHHAWHILGKLHSEGLDDVVEVDKKEAFRCAHGCTRRVYTVYKMASPSREPSKKPSTLSHSCALSKPVHIYINKKGNFFWLGLFW